LNVREEWKPVLNYEGLYEVSSLGAVRRWKKHLKCWRTLTPQKEYHGYRSVRLSRKGVARNAKIYRLVAQAFIGEIPLGYDVDHIDNNRKNDEVSNLRIVTRRQNVSHCVGQKRHAYGEKSGHAKLSEEQVKEIRQQYRNGNGTHRSLARKYGVHYTAIRLIVCGKNWRLV
jgi:hypothetical protein